MKYKEITNYGIAFKYERGSASSRYVKSVDANNGYPDYIISYQDDSLIKDGTYFIKNGELYSFIKMDNYAHLICIFVIKQ